MSTTLEQNTTMLQSLLEAVEELPDGTEITPISNGGTGATTVAGVLLNLGIQAGTASNGGNTSASSTNDVAVTFPTAYAEGTTPIVVVGFSGTSTAYGMGRTSVTAMNATNTGFTIRFYNYDSSARNPKYSWIAIGSPA